MTKTISILTSIVLGSIQLVNRGPSPRLQDDTEPLIQALIEVESNNRPHVTRLESRFIPRFGEKLSTSYGRMQVMGFHTLPGEACAGMPLGASLGDVCGRRILGKLLSTYPTRRKALIAWNGGPGCFEHPRCLAQAGAFADRVLSHLHRR